MQTQGRQWTAMLMVSAMVLASATASSAQTGGQGIQPQTGLPSSQMPGELKNVDFEQRLNTQLPLDLTFRDETGASVMLGDYFKRRPVILTFVYYTCTMLCTQVLTGVTSSLIALDETVGRDFEVVAVSFDPRDTPMAAAAKKAAPKKAAPAPKKASATKPAPKKLAPKKPAVAKKPAPVVSVAPVAASTPAPAIKTVLSPAAAWPFPTGIRP